MSTSDPRGLGLWCCAAFLLAMLHPLFAVADEPAGPAGPAETASSAVHAEVFYATNRKRYEDRPADETYGGGRGEPHFGRCAVAFTPIPFLDEVAGKVP